MQKQKVTDRTHIAKQEDSQPAESSVVEGIDEFLDEVDNLLEDQEVLVGYRQRGGQ